MTLPGYPDGFNPDATHGVTGDDGSIPNLPDRTQSEIIDQLKQQYVLDNPQISGNLSTIFANLRPGVSLPLAIIEALANRLLGTSTLFLSVEQALLALQKVPIIGDLVEVFTGEEDGDLDDLGTWFNNQKANFLALFGIDVNVSPGVFNPGAALFGGGSTQGNEIISGLVNGLRGLFGDWTLTEANLAVASAAETLALNSAAIDALRAAFEQNQNSGVFRLIDFSGQANSTHLPSATWDSLYSGGGGGTYGISNGRAKVTTPGSAATNTRRLLAVYDPETGVKETLTDTQVIVGVWTSAPGDDHLGNEGYVYLRGRSNAAGTIGVHAKLGDRSAEISCIVSGSTTVFGIRGVGGTGTFNFKTNTAYYFLIGTAGGARRFEIHEGKIDGPLILGVNDGSSISLLGAPYRRVGPGAQWDTTPFGWVGPGEMLYFAFADNEFAATVGSTFRAYRTSTSLVNASTGPNFFPASWYPNTAIISPDLAYTSSTNTLKVSIKACYAVRICQQVSSGLLASLSWSPIVAKNGTEVARGNSMYYPAGSGSVMRFADVFFVDCEVDDTLTPGYWLSASALSALRAEAGGIETYWEVKLVNRSLA